MPTTVSCPTCNREVVWDSRSPFRPFCSERCRLIDLGDWLDETHRISDGGLGGDGSGESEPWLSPEDDDGSPRH